MPNEGWRQDLLSEVEYKILQEKIALAKRLAELIRGEVVSDEPIASHEIEEN
jgi:hypothetical protein